MNTAHGTHWLWAWALGTSVGARACLGAVETCGDVCVCWGTRHRHMAQVACGYGCDGVVETQGRPDVMVVAMRDAWGLATHLLGPACVWGPSNHGGTGWRDVISMLSTLGVHWKDILACVLCMVECIMYIGGELGSIQKRGEETHIIWVHCFVCACWRHAWYGQSRCINWSACDLCLHNTGRGCTSCSECLE